MHISTELLFVAIGLLAGTLGSLVGFGGGFIMVPLITLFQHLPSKMIAGTSTAVIVVSAAVSSWVYKKQRRIDLRSGLSFALVSVPGAYIGAHLSHILPTFVFNKLFGTFLIMASLFLVFKPKEAKRSFFAKTSHRSFVDAHGQTFTYEFNMPVGLIAAFFVGFLSSLFGIGGGTVMVPVMVLLLGFPPHIAGATSMFTVLVSAFVGTISHAMLGDVLWTRALFLAIGALIGGFIGPRIARNISGVWLLRVVASLMIVTALRMAFA